ncbi:MAG: substrate-binding domain-containing protein [Spirochaetales bacterium]|nr:substrate-binding domain-containing protein [Spirochaetales bacterium]
MYISKKVRNKKIKTIGIIIDWIGTPYHVNIFSGIYDYAKNLDVNILSFVTGRLNSTDEWEKCRNIFFEFIDDHNIDGLIVFASSIGNLTGHAAVGELLENSFHMPMVTLGEKYPGIPCVTIDNNTSYRKLLEHLLVVHKYKKIGYIGGPQGNSDSEERFSIYREMLGKYNIPYDDKYIFHGDFRIETGQEAVRVLIDEHKIAPEVIVSANDTMALGVFQELRKRRIIIPDKIALVGYDDVEISQYIQLTTVHQPLYEEGMIAAEMLMKIFNGEEPKEIISLTPRLIVRESCGCILPYNLMQPEFKNQRSSKSFTEFLQNRNILIKQLENDIITEEKDRGILTQWIKELLDVIAEEHYSNKKNLFLIRLKKILYWSLYEPDAIVVLKDIILKLKTIICSELQNTNFQGRWIERFEQAEGMIKEATHRAVTFTKILYDYKLESINDFGETLSGCVDLKKLMDILYQELPSLGINRCYISIYEDPDQPLTISKLLLAFDEEKRFPIDLNGIQFSTLSLLPPGILPRYTKYHLIVQSLFLGYDHIGFVIFELGAEDLQTYEILRSKLSIALRRTLMVNRIQNQADYLEKEVIARTKELTFANVKLKQEIVERRRIEEELIKSEERFRELAILLPTILIELNETLLIMFINNEACEALGIGDDERNKKLPFTQFLHEEDKERFSRYCMEIIEKEVSQFGEFRIVQESGEVINLITKANPILRDEKVEGIRLSAINIKPLMSSVIMPEDVFFKHYHFTPRVKEVLVLMLQGYKTKDIAKKLYIAENTVKAHISAIYSEVGVNNREDFFEILKEYQIHDVGYHSYVYSVLTRLFKN